ncbi:MAG: DUF5654 family protein [Patescibacteria group bacterium]
MAEEQAPKDPNLRQEIRQRTLSYVIAAFGLVAGLAWNEAIKGLIDYIFPLENGGSLVAKFIYAVVITVVVVLVTVYLSKAIKKDDK